MPRWPAEPPEVDTTGSSYMVLARGEQARSTVTSWVAAVESLQRPLWIDFAESGDPLTRLRTELQRARTGTRMMVAGPELDVLDVLRTAREAGMIDDELRAHVTSTASRRVHCPHCGEQTIAEVAVNETVRCECCERELIVYHHVSRAMGAYLGYMVDAEAPVR